MKELNVTETQLRSWKPRWPAARLKQKLLADAGMPPAMTWLWGGLAPAMACVLVSLMIYNHDGDPLNPKPMVGMILSSNQSEATYVAEDSHTAQNHLAAVTFDSTNRSGIQSIIGFTPNTNFSN